MSVTNSSDTDTARTDTASERSSSRKKRPWLRLLVVACSTYGVLLIVLSLLETWLLFPSHAIPAADWELPEDCVEAWFDSKDGTRLHGWLLPHPQPQAIVLYCHGNGENVAHSVQAMRELRDTYRATLFVFDYRGYGQSEGRSSDPGILYDGEAALQWLVDRVGCRTSDVIVLGRSMGGAIAVHLAAEHPLRGLVLDRTFSSMTDVVAFHCPWIPAASLLRTKLRSIDKLPKYQGPLLQLHGAADTLVPLELGRRLFAAATTENKTFVELPGAGHNAPWNGEAHQKFAEALTHW